MRWWSSKVDIPESSITDNDIIELKKRVDDVTTQMTKMEKAVLNGEHTWMLIKCDRDEKPKCISKVEVSSCTT